MPFRLTRVSDQPILKPRKDVEWEQDAVFNTAAFRENGITHLFYRAVCHPGWKFRQPGGRYDSCIGHAVSADGINFTRADEPILRWGVDPEGVPDDPQDPRITKIDDTYHLVYVRWEIGTTWYTYPSLAVSKDLKTWEKRGSLIPYKDFGFNKNTALFPSRIAGRYAVLHRPECARYRHLEDRLFNWDTWSRGEPMEEHERPGVTVAYSSDLKTWTDSKVVMTTRPGYWDDMKCGPGAQPIRTEKGWLIVYHGVDKANTYRLGVAMLALDDPHRVLFRQDEPILEPELEWERNGDVPNVVFTCGAVLEGNELSVYYGGADTVIGLARGDVTELLGRV